MEILNDIIQTIHKTTQEKLTNLSNQIAIAHANDGGYGGGVIYQGLIISPYYNNRITSQVYKLNEQLSPQVVKMCEEYAYLLEKTTSKQGLLKQLLAVIWLRTGKNESLLFNNLPQPLVNRLLSGRPETPEELLYREAKQDPVFWRQYEEGLVKYVLFTFGFELILQE